jgi:hypothetical protein
MFLSVATDAHAEMKRLVEEGRTPKPDGTPGYILALDPEHRSFKQALIVVTFAGIYFEALTYFVARQKSKSQAEKVDGARYRGKLERLGINEEALLQVAESFQLDRNDLVHEKASPAAEVDWGEVRFAQSCADKAMDFIVAVQRALSAAIPLTPRSAGTPIKRALSDPPASRGAR